MSRLSASVSIIECADAVALEQILSTGMERYLVRLLEGREDDD